MKTLILFLLASLPVMVLESANDLETGNRSKPNTMQSIQSKNREHADMCCIENANSSSLPDNSIYQLHSLWKDQNGKPFNVSSLRGKVEIIAMFYSHCTYACPLTINDMKTVEYNLPKDLKDEVGFVLVSFDPKRDTPQALKSLASNQNLDPIRWTLLTGSNSDIRSLAAVLGVEFKKKSNGDFLHSSQITVLDSQGKIVFKHLGLNQPTNDVVQAVERLTSQRDLRDIN